MEDNKPKNVHIETYADHLAGAMHDTGEGTVRQIIEQERAYEEAKNNLSPKKLTNQLYLYSGIVLIMVALGVFGYVAMGKAKKEVPLKPQFTSIILNDETNFIEVQGEKEDLVKEIILKAKDGQMKKEDVRGLYLVEAGQVIGLSRFLPIFEVSVVLPQPSPLKENFLMGAVAGDTRDLFLLMEINSFAEAFNFLRGWEDKMFEDLHDLYEIPLGKTTAYLQAKDFEDGIIENKNARILRDNEGNIVLMYVFADDDFIIVAKEEEAVREVILRLAGSMLNR